MELDFAGKVVLVTGASRGIGREIAQQFSESGARVAINYRRNRQAAEQTLAELAGDGHVLLQGDVSDPAVVQSMTQAAIREMGQIDVLVNNAGIYIDHPIADVGFDAWHDAWQGTLATNLVGPANLSYCVARHMMERGGGRIVNVSSRGAFRGEPDGPAYGASKAGMNAMSQSLAKALAPHNVFVFVVAPGFVETDMAAESLTGPMGDSIRNQSPLGRVAIPLDIARTVLFLASEGSEFLTGCIVDINGASYLRT
jgi:NAD(P)-dependent dehydrogenase (short-subunit alcohol dehydrogenase family)